MSGTNAKHRLLLVIGLLVAGCQSPAARPPDLISTGIQRELAGESGRHFVICMDGTWNKPASETNVWQTYELARSRPKADKVIPVYVRGVGTTTATKKLGGKKGLGATKRTRQAYGFLCEWWNPGDSITLVGFSRGAYQARLLAWAIDTFGVYRGEYPPSQHLPGPRALHLDLAVLLDLSSAEYSHRLDGTPFRWDRDHSRANAEKYTFGRWNRDGWEDPDSDGWKAATVANLVCFDTVAAIAEIVEIDDVLFQDYDDLPLHLRAAPESTQQVLHALALDEKRRAFGLVTFPRDERVKQVWFAGAHSDVGGGYERAGLNRNSLNWVLTNLSDPVKQAMGVSEDELVYLPLATLHDPSKTTLPFWAKASRGELPGSQIHPTVWERLAEDGSYNPPGWVAGYLTEGLGSNVE